MISSELDFRSGADKICSELFQGAYKKFRTPRPNRYASLANRCGRASGPKSSEQIFLDFSTSKCYD